MLGSHHPGFQLDPDVKDAVARKKFTEVSEEYGLEADDVKVEFDSSLPYNVLGRTEMPRYSDDEVTIKVGDRFMEADEYQQEKTMVHEGIHSLQFKNEVDDWLREEFNASESFIREVERSSDPLYEKEIEGITEVLTDNILPFDVGTGYPYEKRMKQDELEAKGFDVESELMDDIDDELESIGDDYFQVYQTFEVGNVYMEKGSIGDLDYTMITVGDDITDYRLESGNSPASSDTMGEVGEYLS